MRAFRHRFEIGGEFVATPSLLGARLGLLARSLRWQGIDRSEQILCRTACVGACRRYIVRGRCPLLLRGRIGVRASAGTACSIETAIATAHSKPRARR